MDKYPLIGKLIIKNKFLLKEDIDQALSAWSGNEEEFVNYLISTRLISSEKIKSLQLEAKKLKARDDKLKFGNIAVSKGFIDKTNLDFVLEEQENDMLDGRQPKLLGDMLIEAGMITPQQRDLVLESQKKFLQEASRLPADEDASSLKESLLLEPISLYSGLNLQLSGDFLSAYLIKTEKFNTNCRIEGIKAILTAKGITFGIVTDEMIKSFIKSAVFKKKPFRVAKGIKPVHGEDAKIAYYFDTGHLKAGDVNNEGQIDFKARGRIPQIDKGMVLAEKTPMVDPVNGKNIYGETVYARSAENIDFKIGKGAVLSENGLQVLASVKGHPIKKGGEIVVQEEYIINGDVGYETGHIDYDGDINIKGCINSGFKVKGDNISVYEIDDGIIDANGNVKIASGINNGEIKALGNLSAKFIHKSHISCMGDVSVNNEILDAIVRTRGKCIVDTGKIISSEIISKLGVFVKDIGTEKGKPSTIIVGHDVFTEKELMDNKIALEKFNKTLEAMLNKQGEKKEKNKTIQQGIFDYGQIQDTSQTMQQKILDKMKSLKNNDQDIEIPEPVKEKLNQLQIDINQAEEKLKKFLLINQELDQEIKDLGYKIGKHKLKIKNLEFERESLIKWEEKNPGKSIVNASGIIMAKTIIQGKHSKRMLDKEVKNVQVKELRDTSLGAGPEEYKIEIIN